MILHRDPRHPDVLLLLAGLSAHYLERYGATDVTPEDLDVALVAYDGSAPVGVVGWHEVGPGSVHIRRLYVRPEARGRGVGEQLASAVVRAARDTGHAQVNYDAESDHTWVHAQGCRLLVSRTPALLT